MKIVKFIEFSKCIKFMEFMKIMKFVKPVKFMEFPKIIRFMSREIYDIYEIYTAMNFMKFSRLLKYLQVSELLLAPTVNVNLVLAFSQKVFDVRGSLKVVLFENIPNVDETGHDPTTQLPGVLVIEKLNPIIVFELGTIGRGALNGKNKFGTELLAEETGVRAELVFCNNFHVQRLRIILRFEKIFYGYFEVLERYRG